MHHVRVAEHNMGASADGAPRILGCITVVREDPDFQVTSVRQPVRELMQLSQLVLRQGLGRKQVQGARRGIPQHGTENRRVVAKGLP